VVSDAPSIDESYRALCASLPHELRPAARGLPHRLGLTKTPDGGWEEFVNLHPNRDLPIYAAEGVVLPAARQIGFLRAHHYGGFAWLLRDRLADGQVVPESELLALVPAFYRRWLGALEQAAGDRARVVDLVADVGERWQRGIAAERDQLRSGQVQAADYAALVRDKLRWIATPSTCLIAAAAPGDPAARAARARAFQRAYDLFLLGLQAVDDVNDEREDRALYGTDVAGALGCSSGALLRVAPKLVSRAAAVATNGGFGRLGSWLSAYARAISAWRRDGDPMSDELEAIAIAGAMEERIDDDIRREGQWDGQRGGTWRD
jgi:hypothetical protein